MQRREIGLVVWDRTRIFTTKGEGWPHPGSATDCMYILNPVADLAGLGGGNPFPSPPSPPLMASASERKIFF